MPDKQDTNEDQGLLHFTLEDLRGKTPEDLHKIAEILEVQIRDMHQTETGELRDLDDNQEKAFNLAMQVRTEAIKRIEEHRAITEALRLRPKAIERVRFGGFGDDPVSDVRRIGNAEARDRALRTLDNDRLSPMTDDQRKEVERQIRRDTYIARRVLVTENEDYRAAWMKMVTDPAAIATLSDDERNALRAFDEYRNMGEITPSAGGFGIPVFIDPSIILTAQGTENPFLQLAQSVNVNTNIWKGVTSAGVTWVFQTEAAEVTDGSPTLAQPTVTVHMARGFIPYSIELGQDYPGFADQMASLLANGYDELLIDKFTRGSGTGEPRGLLTALSANTNVRVRVQTSGSGIDAGAPYRVWEALGQRFRRRANWLMSVNVNDAIRQLGTANVYHAFTVSLPDDWADTLFRRGVYESPYMPSVTTSTSSPDGYAIVGDFSNYVIARRGGMNVELIPQVFGASSHFPTGQRGWFAYARIGGNSVNDLGFRLLVNT